MNTPPKTHGKKGYFGTTNDETLGFIIHNASLDSAGSSATFADGYGETVSWTGYDRKYTGELSGKMLNNESADSARTAIAFGALLNLPQIAGVSWPEGAAIIESTKQARTHTDNGDFTVSITIYPNISKPTQE